MQVLQEPKKTIFSKDNPFPARVINRFCLTKEGSAKNTQHVTVDLSGSDLEFECGDSIGVHPENDPVMVQDLLDAYRFSGQEQVILPKADEPISLKEALTHKLSLAGPTKKFMNFLFERASDLGEKQALEILLAEENTEVLKDFLYNREFVDLGYEFPSARLQPQELVGFLKKLLPRLYSIASTPLIDKCKVDLTLAVVKYRTNGRDRIGVATTYLSERVLKGETAFPVFVAKSHFKMPESSEVDIIMVGPGTGVAPFRGFMQEHVSKARSGRTWLFFGEQHRATDYLYQEDWENWQKQGSLARLDLAFSRDQKEKVYVQDKMRESAEDLWSWIEGGAYFYVCGDAKHMAKDVEVTLMDIFQKHGNMDEEAAKAFLKALKKEKRYQKDVY